MTIVLCCVFFLSGASALVFESLWFQLLGITVGNSVWASTIVFSAFMAGLALGNGFAIIWGNKIQNPVKLYAYLELIIALSGLFVVIFLPKMPSLCVPLFQFFSTQPLVLNTLRGIVSFILLVLPATAMGATLPILVKALLKKNPNFGRVLGLLYGWNTIGAVFGVIANELFFVKMLGLSGAGILAGGLNLLVASVVLMIDKHTSAGPMKHSSKSVWPRLRSFADYKFLATGFIMGFTILALEVIWFRFMLLFFNAHSQNFTIILATVLSGIGLGGLTASKWFEKQPEAHRYLYLMLIAEGLIVPILYRYFHPLLQIFGKASMPGEKQSLAFLSLIFIFPVTFFSGIIFTMIGNALEARLKEGITATGLLTMTNTTGGMLGAMLAAMMIIPTWGVEIAFFVCAFIFGLMALLFLDKSIFGHNRVAAIASIALTFVLIVWIFPFGIMKAKYLNYTYEYFFKDGERRVVIRESLTETIQLLQKDIFGKPHYHRLITNSHSMAATTAWCKRYMKLYVYLPVALMEHPKNALLICYGTGMTAKALTDTRHFDHIDIVDTSKDIFEMSKIIFENPAENPLNDLRVRRHTEDGRFFLLTTENSYDLITAEPPPPKYKGIANLYSKEYFKLIHERLNEGGMVTYWLPVHLMQISATRSIVKGFSEVFENCSLWQGAGYNWMMVGVKGLGKKVPASAFSEQWNNPVTGSEIRALGFIEPEQLGSLFIADGKRLRDWISDSPPLVDNFPYRLYDGGISFQNVRSLRNYDQLGRFWASLENFKNSEFIKTMWPEQMVTGAEKYFVVRDVVNECIKRSPDPPNLVTLYILHRIIDASLPDPYFLWALKMDEHARLIFDEASQKLPEAEEVQAYMYLFQTSDALKTKNFKKAEAYLEKAADILESNHPNLSRNLQLYLIYLFWRTGEREKLIEAEHRYVAPALQGMEQRKRELNSILRWLQETFDGTD